MPSTFQKTRKQIAKKRNGNLDALHKFSRDSKRLHKAGVRDERLDKLAAARSKKEQPLLDRATQFQHWVGEAGSGPLRPEAIQELILKFVRQFDEELDTLKKARRLGRPATAKEDLLRRRISELESEYQNGFLLPDLTTSDNVLRLDRWEGSWSYLCTLSWVRVSSSGQVKPSTFPPSSGNH